VKVSVRRLTASGGIEYSWDNVNDGDCNGAYFIGGLQNNGAQSLYRYTSGGTLTEIGATGTTRLNGVGFYCQGENPKIYGMVRKGDDITTAIQADFAVTDARTGATTVLGAIPLPPNPYGLGGVSGILNFIGEMTPEGDFIFPAISARINPFTFQIEQYTVYIGTINVGNHGNGSNVSYEVLNIEASCDVYMDACVEAFRAYALNPAGREPSGGIQDWTLSPDGRYLYSFLGIENALLKIDLSTNTAFCTPGPNSNLAFTGTVGVQTDEFGGLYYEGNTLYGWQVDRGRVFEINTSTAGLSLITTGLPLDYRGDNATCLPCGNGGSDEPTIEVCPEETTTYTVTVTDANGCTSTKSVTVVVRDFEAVVILASDKDICHSERTTLTAPAGDAYIWNTGETTQSITVSPTTTTNYSVTITRNGKCDGIGNVTINLRPDPTIIFEGQNEICRGDCTQILASGGTIYQWSGGGIQSSGASIEVCPTENTTYFVTVTSEFGCKSTGAFSVVVKDKPIVTIAGNEEICQGISTTLTATGGGDYLWSTGQTTGSIIVNPNVTTNYSVTVSGPLTCEVSAQITVKVNPRPVVNITGNNTLCVGECTRLETQSGFFYLWIGPGFSSNESFIEVCPEETTTYSLLVTDSLDCFTELFYEVNVKDKINGTITGNTNLCTGETTVLTASGGSAYLWSTGAVTSSITVSPANTTTYTVTISDQNLCSDVTSVIVNVNNNLQVDIIGDLQICTGECTSLTASGGSQYEWSAPGFSSSEASITVCPDVTTTYTVMVTNANGCKNSQSVTVVVNTPSSLIITGETSICAGDSTILTVTGGATYLWNTGENTASIIVKPDADRTFSVTSIDAGGCLLSASVNVRVSPLPNVFIVYNSEVCEGTSVLIRASGGETYQWSTGQNTQSIFVTPLVTTTFIVTVTSGFNCNAVDSVQVKVKPKPSIVFDGNEQICYGDSAIIVASLDAYNECPDECKISDSLVLAYWDLEACHAFASQGTHINYSEFIPATFSETCLEVNATNVRRNQGEHSCSFGFDDTGVSMCIGGQETCNSSKVDYNQALQFSVNIRPGQTGRITGLQFYEASPEQFEWVMGISGPNNYLQKYLIRVLKDGKIIYYKDELTSQRDWNLVTFDFANNNHFAFSKETEFIFEIIPYCPVGNGAEHSVWDIDEIKVLGGCCTTGNHGSITYLWSNGSTEPGLTVSPEETSEYTVTVTDCCGCSATSTYEVRVNNIKVDLGPDVMIEEGQSITLRPEITGNSICPDSLTSLFYRWSTGATTDSIVVSPAISFVYSLDVTDCMECTGRGRKFVFVNPESNGVNTIYPNPTAGKFQVLSVNPLSDDLKIRIFTADGKLVGNNELPHKKLSQLHIEIDLPDQVRSGMYLLEMNNGGIVTTTKLIVVDR
jgi:hypothetical protein